MLPLDWFISRIHQDVLRNKRIITIRNEKEAHYYHSLQPHFTYEERPK